MIYSHLPTDLLRLILSFTCTPKTVWNLSIVCKPWRLAIDHPSTWTLLCAHAGWAIPASIRSTSDRSLIRAFFVARYRTIRLYARGYWTRRSWNAHAAGILALSIPPSKKFYSWTDGAHQTVDDHLLISAASAPTYGLKMWKLDGASASANGAAECVNEQHVFGNPLLTAVEGGPPGNNPGAHPLDPREASLKVHWSCVDVVNTHVEEEQNEETAFERSTSMSFESLSEANSASSSSSSSRPPPPQRPSTNFLLFAGMQRPLLYLYDLRTKRLRSFKSGHESAICCVKMSRTLGDPVSSSSQQPTRMPSGVGNRRLAVSGSYDHSTCAWDVDTGSLVARLKSDCRTTVWCVDIHPTRRLVAAGSDDGAVRIYKLNRPASAIADDSDDSDDEEEDGAHSPERKAQRRRAKKLAEMKRLLGYSASGDGQGGNEQEEKEFISRYANDSRFASPPLDPLAVAAAAAASAASTSASAEATPVDFGGVHIATLKGHTACPMTLQFDPHSPDTRLWSAGYDRTIRVWDISHVHRRRTRVAVEVKRERDAGDEVVPPHAAAATSSSSPYTVDDSKFSPPCLLVFTGHTSVIFSLILTPHVLISTSRDGSVRVWDKDTGRLLRNLEAGRANSDLVSEIASGNQSSDQHTALTSSRAQAFDIKCAVRTQQGDIVTASSDGRIALFEFERREHGSSSSSGSNGGGGNGSGSGGNGGGSSSSSSAGQGSIRRANSGSNTGSAGAAAQDREACTIM
jgi:WD40 repeat protein